MESCKSDCLQSSSGGEEEYDSRATTFVTCGGSINPNPPPPLTPFFDPFVSNYPPLNNFIGSPNTNNGQITNDDDIGNNNKTSTTTTTTANDTNPYTTSFHLQAAAPPPTQTAARNPKKRSRASRRAPTTILTTDTTNFRAMVQEFTGIPSPPFVDGSPFTRGRLDLFASSLDAPPSYLRRPFAQKFQPPLFPFLAASHTMENPVSITTKTSSTTSQSSNIFSNIDQSFFLRSPNWQANHQKCNNNLFGLESNSPATDHHLHHHFGSDNVTTSFDSGLVNLITTSANDVSNIQNDFSHGDAISAAMWNNSTVRRDEEDGLSKNGERFNLSGPSNGEKRHESGGGEGMTTVETWICSYSD